MTTTSTQRELTLDTDTVDTIAVLEAESVRAARPSRAKLSWASESDGEWIADYSGHFGGSVDKVGGRYVASDTFGMVVGDFDSLEDAQTSLADRLHVMLPPVIRIVD